jgi:hypothetical protein
VKKVALCRLVHFVGLKQNELRVAYSLKATTVKQAEAAIAREGLCKHAYCYATDS